MDRYKQAIRTKVVGEVLSGKLSCAQAAQSLGVNVRTLQNYLVKFRQQGAQGLLDRRHGHFYKLRSEHEELIVKQKFKHPYFSALWIRNYLRLPVSVETVRQVLVRHHLNRSALRTRFDGSPRKRPARRA